MFVPQFSFQVFDHPMSRGFQNRFSTQYRCYSVSMLAGPNDRSDVEKGGKSKHYYCHLKYPPRRLCVHCIYMHLNLFIYFFKDLHGSFIFIMKSLETQTIISVNHPCFECWSVDQLTVEVLVSCCFLLNVCYRQSFVMLLGPYEHVCGSSFVRSSFPISRCLLPKWVTEFKDFSLYSIFIEFSLKFSEKVCIFCSEVLSQLWEMWIMWMCFPPLTSHRIKASLMSVLNIGVCCLP